LNLKKNSLDNNKRKPFSPHISKNYEKTLTINLAEELTKASDLLYDANQCFARISMVSGTRFIQKYRTELSDIYDLSHKLNGLESQLADLCGRINNA
jgi:hypothetical protein